MAEPAVTTRPNDLDLFAPLRSRGGLENPHGAFRDGLGLPDRAPFDQHAGQAIQCGSEFPVGRTQAGFVAGDDFSQQSFGLDQS